MSIKRSGLGRGLDALLPTKKEGGLQQIDITLLKPSRYQPRKHFDPQSVAELAASIAEKGVLQPLLLRSSEEGFEIIAGERRYRAALQAGLRSVPAIIRELDDQETLEIAIIENLQREDLNPVEEAQAFEQLLQFGMNQDQVAQRVGKSRSAVANSLRLLKLSAGALEALRVGRLSAGHARAILAQPKEDQDWALEQIESLGLSVREAERLSRQPPMQDTDSQVQERAQEVRSRGEGEDDAAFQQLEQDLARQFGTNVRIAGRSRGKIELSFYSREDLDRLLALLGYQG